MRSCTRWICWRSTADAIAADEAAQLRYALEARIAALEATQTGHAGMARMTLMIQSGHCVIGLSQAEMILVIAAQATMALRARFSILISRYGMGATMRRSSIVAIALVSTAAFVQIAAAADLPMKAPPPPPPVPVSQWTGCYIGVNAGGTWGHMKDEWTPSVANGVQGRALVSANANATLDGSGFTGGGQAGCNLQLSATVLGLEGDIQYTGFDVRRDVFFPGIAGVFLPSNFHEDFSSKWLATFRERLGWLVTPNVLVYGTGGVAVANIKPMILW